MPDGFVEVSGYSETDLQNSYNVGLLDGADDAVDGTTATQAQVLSGATFSSQVVGIKKTGLMPNQGTKTYTINPGQQQSIPAGYHNGNGWVKANPNQNTGTYTCQWDDVGTIDLGANNTYRYVNTTNVYNQGVSDTRVGNALEGQVLEGKTFTNNGGLTTGTMRNRGTLEVTVDPNETYARDVTMDFAGYYSACIIKGSPNTGTYTTPSSLTRANYASCDMGIANLKRYVDARPAYDAGVAATKVGTAVASDVRQGKTFTNSSGVNIQGTLVDNAVYSTSLPAAPNSNIDMGGLFRYLSQSIVNDLSNRADGWWVNSSKKERKALWTGSLNGERELLAADAVGDNYNNYIVVCMGCASCEDSTGHYPAFWIDVPASSTVTKYNDGESYRVANATRQDDCILILFLPKGTKNPRVRMHTDYAATVIAQVYVLSHY